MLFWPFKKTKSKVDPPKLEAPDNQLVPAVIDVSSSLFNLVNPHAVEWAKSHAGSSVQNVSDQTRQILRDLIPCAMAGQMTRREIAAQILPLLQLLPEEARQIAEYSQQIAAKGYKGLRFDKAIERHSLKLLRVRAERIVATEINRASNEGERNSWEEAVKKGYLNLKRTWRVWIATPGDSRTCDLCLKMHNKKARLNEHFETPLGPISGPPLHDGCRCTTGLSFDRK